MIAWAKEHVAAALDLTEAQREKGCLAFSTAVGENWQKDKGGNWHHATWEKDGETGNYYKASAHLVINGYKMKWIDQGGWVRQMGLIETAFFHA
jgi:hypothetical protein